MSNTAVTSETENMDDNVAESTTPRTRLRPIPAAHDGTGASMSTDDILEAHISDGCSGHAATCDAQQEQCCYCFAYATSIVPAPITTEYVEAGEPVCAKCLTPCSCDNCDATVPHYAIKSGHAPSVGDYSLCPECRR